MKTTGWPGKKRNVRKFIIRSAAGLALIASPIASSAGERTVTLAVDNMACVVCAFNVKQSLERVAGVIKVQVLLKEKIAVVVYDDATTDLNELTGATARAGFPSALKN
jgi:periplasmic mercuric ion binding protein